MKWLLVSLMALTPVLLVAQTETTTGHSASAKEELQPPPVPLPIVSGSVMEPAITIIKTEKETIEEYRVDGVVQYVKITPNVGPSYYLLDTDGDGQLDITSDSIYNANTQMWQIFSWD